MPPIAPNIQKRMMELAQRRFDDSVDPQIQGAAIDELINLIDKIDTMDLRTARTLMTLMRDPPNGIYPDAGHVNEHIGAAVESAPPIVWCQAVLEELTVLIDQAPYMLADFLARANNFHPKEFIHAFEKLPEDKQRAIAKTLLSDPEIVKFLEEHAHASGFLAILNRIH